jgi:hypothetical protein
MTERKQWVLTLAICALAVSCAMFRGPTVKDGKVCEVIDFGNGTAFEICAGTASELEQVKVMAAARRESLKK